MQEIPTAEEAAQVGVHDVVTKLQCEVVPA
jgi:hypothetical protein